MPAVAPAVAAWAAANAAVIFWAKVVIFAASLAYAVHSQRKAKQAAKDSWNASLRDRNVTIRSSISPVQIPYGTVATGGTLVYAQTSGGLSEVLTLVIAVARNEIDSFVGLYLDEENILPLTGDAARSGSRYHPASGNPSTDAYPVVVDGTGKCELGFVPASVLGVYANNVIASLVFTNGETISHTFVPGNSYVTVAAGLAGQTVYVWATKTFVGTPYVWASLATGAAGQVADAWLVANSNGAWTSNSRGDSVAYAVVRMLYNENLFPTGVPPLRAVVKGKKCYDPRSGLTVWTDNPALIARDYLTASLGFAVPAGEIDDSLIIAAANVCDEVVPVANIGTVTVTNGSATVTGSGTAFAAWMVGKYFTGPNGVPYVIASYASATSLTLATVYGGTNASGAAYSIGEKRYVCNTLISTDNDPLSNLDIILSSMAGTRSYSQGKWRIHAGAYAAPVMSLDDSMLAGGQVSVIPRAPKAQLFNEVKGIYVDPTRAWQPTDFPAVKNPTYVTQDGGTVLATDVALPATTSALTAQRIAKVILEQSRQALVVQATFNLKAYKVQAGDNVWLTIARYGFSSKVFKVISRRFDPSKGVELILREEASGAYSWNFGEATAVDLAPNTTLPNPYAAVNLAGIAVASGNSALQRLADGTIISRIRVSWSATSDPRLASGKVEIEYRQGGDDVWKAIPPVRGDEAVAYCGPVEDGKVYYIRIRTVNALGVRSDWSNTAHTVVGKTALPPNVSTMTVAVLAGGARRFTITAPTGVADGASVVVRYVTGSSADWAAMSQFRVVPYNPDVGTYVFETNEPIEGTWSFGAKLIDTTGNESSAGVFVSNAALGTHPKTYGNTFNRLLNADFTHSWGPAYDWPNYFANGTGIKAWSTNVIGDTNPQVFRNYLYGRVYNVGRGGAGVFHGTRVEGSYVYFGQRIACAPNEHYEASAYVNPTNCNVILYLRYLAADLTTVTGEVTDAYNAAVIAENTYPGDIYDPMKWVRLFAHMNAPANTAYVDVYLLKETTTPGRSYSWTFWHKAQLCIWGGGTSRAEALPWVPSNATEDGEVWTEALNPGAATNIYTASSSGTGHASTDSFSGAHTFKTWNAQECSVSVPVKNGDVLAIHADFIGAVGNAPALYDWTTCAVDIVVSGSGKTAWHTDGTDSTGNLDFRQAGAGANTTSREMSISKTYTATADGTVTVHAGGAAIVGGGSAYTESGRVFLRVERIKR